ncbi:MAG: hypothetical protein AB7V19_05210 [Candidatus Bipolaricaulia bacterium]
MKASSTASPPDNPPTSQDPVLYADLFAKAHDEGLRSIRPEMLVTPSDENGRLAIVKAVVEIEGTTSRASAMLIPAASRTSSPGT